ncbi:MAG TPA: hypothetical protein VM618_12280 [Acidimicrobiia bacterium]|nr:hypothetical protein [Acidimicrobiia bacterium]
MPRDAPPLMARPADYLVWPLVALVFVLGLAAVPVMVPDRCTDEALAWAEEEGVSWSGGETSAWPPTVKCEFRRPNGEARVVEYESWPGAVGLVLAGGIFLVGMIRPPSWGWRRAAHVMTVPLVIGTAAMTFLATADRGGALPGIAGVTGALAAVALIPAALIAASIVTARQWAPGRTFAASWVASAIGLVVLFALPAIL